MSKMKKNKLLSFALAKESFGKIRVNLESLGVDKDLKCVCFTSAVSGEGKSTMVSNVGISMAVSNKKTLVIDADMRNPTQHRMFSLMNQTGLSEIVIKKLDWREYTNATHIPNLYVLTAGSTPPNPSELLGSQTLDKIIGEMKCEFDFILFDSTPVLVVPDALALSRHTDGAILVTRYRFSRQKAIKAACDALKLAHSPVLGCILNAESDLRAYYGYNYKYINNNQCAETASAH